MLAAIIYPRYVGLCTWLAILLHSQRGVEATYQIQEGPNLQQKSVCWLVPGPNCDRTRAKADKNWKKTIHSVCVTKGPLGTYLYVACPCIRWEERHRSKMITRTVGTQLVYFNLLEILLRPFMGRWCCATMDSVYRGNLLAQVAINP